MQQISSLSYVSCRLIKANEVIFVE